MLRISKIFVSLSIVSLFLLPSCISSFPHKEYDGKTIDEWAAQMKSPNDDLRYQAVIKLGEIKDNKVFPFLIESLNDKNIIICVAGVGSLSMIGDSRAIQPSIKVFEKIIGLEHPKFMNISLFDATSISISKYGKKAIPYLLNAIKDDNDMVRAGAIATLGNIMKEIANGSVEAALIFALENDKSDDVRVCAAKALYYADDAVKISSSLLKALKDKNATVRRYCAYSLRNCRADQNIIKALIGSLDDVDFNVRREAISTLSIFRKKINFSDEIIIEFLKNDDEIVRAEAVYMFDTHSIPFLIKKLDASNKKTQIGIIAALGRLKSKDAVIYLLKFANGDDIDLKVKSIWALGEIGNRGSIQYLIPTLRSDSNSVRETALAALIKVTKQDFGTDPAKWQEWWDANKARILKEEAENEKAEKEKISEDK